jgi:siderophore synthetase component
MEYSKERNLLERYAFKSATALSLEGYTTLLINTFGKEKEVNEEKILEFVINSMAQIYQEPFQPTKESKVTISFDGKVASLKADIAKTMEETKKSVINGVKEEIKKALPTNTI